MPEYLPSKTLDLTAARARLDGRLDDLAEQAAQASDDSHERQQAVSEAGDIQNTYLPGLDWAIDGHPETDFDGWGDEATVKLTPPDAMTYAQVEDGIADWVGSAGEGVGRNFTVAQVVDDAPWADDDWASATLGERVTTVGQFHPGFLKWLEHEAEQLLVVESGNRTPFEARAAAKLSTTSDDEPR